MDNERRVFKLITMKVYEYCVNGFIKGSLVAKSKREVKEHCQELAKIWCPTRGIETMKIERIKE